jgi:hypothetical protein
VAAALIGVTGRLGVRAQGRRRRRAAGKEAGCGSCGRTAGSGEKKVMTDGPHLAARQREGGGVGRLANWASKRRAAGGG